MDQGKKTSFNISKPSEGENYIKEFLEEYEIKNETQKEIHNLSYDSKQHRKADFFLTDYEVYIEFFGQWNNTNPKFQEDYRTKKDVYIKNKIPCIYLYPDNLGTLEYFLDKRLQDELIKYSRLNALRRYKRYKFFRSFELKDAIRSSVISIAFLIGILNSSPFGIKHTIGSSICLIILGYQIWRIVKLYKQIFIEQRYSLGKLH